MCAFVKLGELVGCEQWIGSVILSTVKLAWGISRSRYYWDAGVGNNGRQA